MKKIKQKRAKQKKTVRILVVFVATVFLLLWMLLNQKDTSTYFKNNHFNQWELNYPMTKELDEFKDDLSFPGSKLDYIVFPNNEIIVSDLNDYIVANLDYLEFEGIKEKDSEVLKQLIAIVGDEGKLLEYIVEFDDYDFYIFSRPENIKLSFVISETELVFLFFKY